MRLLREADKSYVGKELQKEWNREKAEKEILLLSSGWDYLEKAMHFMKK